MLSPDLKPAIVHHQDGVSGVHLDIHTRVSTLTEEARAVITNVSTNIKLEKALKELGQSAVEEKLVGENLQSHQEEAVKPYNEACAEAGMDSLVIELRSIMPPGFPIVRRP